MRTLLTCAFLIASGCGGKKEPPKPTETPAASGSAPAATVDAAPTPKPAGDFESHMKAGSALEDQKKWSEALVEFQAALDKSPDDARALAEIGFTAYHAGNLALAKEASVSAVKHAKTDKKLRGAALFNLGLAVEKTLPHAAAALYAASLADRPNRVVQARAAKLQQNKDVGKATKDGDALMAEVGVKPAPPPSTPSSMPGTPIDQAMMAALEGAGVEWDSGAGKSVLLVENVDCRESHQTKPTSYSCKNPDVKGKFAQAIVENLATRKVAPTKEHGDVVTYKVGSIRCRTFNEGESAQPDVCEVTP